MTVTSPFWIEIKIINFRNFSSIKCLMNFVNSLQIKISLSAKYLINNSNFLNNFLDDIKKTIEHFNH